MNYMQQPMENLKVISDPTTAMNMTLVLMAKAFKLNYTTPTNNNQIISSNPRNIQIAQPDLVVDCSWPKVREFAFAKPHHMIAPGSSRYSPEESCGSNDMVHNYYLEEARKKTQARNRNFKPRETPSASTHNTPHDCKPKPRSNNQTSRNWPASKSSDVTLKAVQKAEHSRNSRSYSDSKHFVCSRCQKCVFNANHDACVTKFPKKVNSSAKVQSHKTRNSNKPVEQKIHTQKPKPTGRIFKTVGLRWVPTRNIFASCTSKVDSEPTHGSNVDIFKIHECKQTLDLSAGTSINVQKEQSIDLSVGASYNVMKENLRVWLLKKPISHKSVLQWIQN
ncbi:hypothetical protein Tco_1493985 [Tanacetum coccineum]